MPHPFGRLVCAIVRLIVLIVCIAVPFGCDADTQVLGRDQEIVDPGRATPRYFVVDGKRVEAWVAASPPASAHGPQAFVLFFTGQADRADRYVADVANSWDRWPVEVWGLNYPGSGGSEGPNKIARVSPAALALFDLVKERAGNRPIFLQAVSFGTSVALSVAARRPVAGVILSNPPPLRQLIVGEFSWWNLGLISHCIANEVPTDLDSIANAARCTAPMVVLSAGDDQTVPPKYQRMVIDAYAGPKKIITMPRCDHDDPIPEEADHALSTEKDRLWKISKETPTVDGQMP